MITAPPTRAALSCLKRLQKSCRGLRPATAVSVAANSSTVVISAGSDAFGWPTRCEYTACSVEDRCGTCNANGPVSGAIAEVRLGSGCVRRRGPPDVGLRQAARPARSTSGREACQITQRLETLQRLALELANPLAREIELVADRLERPGLALEPEAKLEDAPLALGKSVERLAGCSGDGATPRPRRTGRPPRGRRRDRPARPRRPRRPSGSARPTRGRPRAPRRRAAAEVPSPRRAPPSSPPARAPPRAGERRARASADARRRAPARGSSARGSRRRAAPTGGSTRSRTSRT